MYKFLATMEVDGNDHKLNLIYVCAGKRPTVEEVQDMINICEGYVITNLVLMERTDTFECKVLRRSEYRDHDTNVILRVVSVEKDQCQNCYYFSRRCPSDRECNGRRINYVYDRPITSKDELTK